MGRFLIEVRELVTQEGAVIELELGEEGPSEAGPLRGLPVGRQYYRTIGQIDDYLDLDIILRHNDVSSWKIRVMGGTPSAQLLKPGRGVVIWYEGVDEPVITGPMREINRWCDDTNTGPGSIDYIGVCDNTLLADHVGFPISNGWMNTSNFFASWDAAAKPPSFSKPTAGYDGDGQQIRVEWAFRAVADYNFGRSQEEVYDRVNKRWRPYTATERPAAPGRRVPGIDPEFELAGDLLQESGIRGYPQTTYKIRFDNLLEVFQGIADGVTNKVGSGEAYPMPYAFRFVHDTAWGKVRLKFWPIRDRTKYVRFSQELGNLQRYNYTLKAAKSNRFVFGTFNADENKPGTRRFHVWPTPDGKLDKGGVWSQSLDEWANWSEEFFDRRDVQPENVTSGPWEPYYADLKKAADEVSEENKPVASLSIEPIDTDQCKFGRDYQLGDKVTVVIDGEEYHELLREVHLTDSPDDGPRVVPTVGTGDASETPTIYKDVKKLWEKLRKVSPTKR